MAIEDFTTWTEGDPESRLTVTADTITIDSLYRDEDGTWVYKDFGAGYFSGDFTFRMKFTTPVDDTQINSSAIIYPLMLANTVDEPDAIDGASGDYQGFTFQRVVNSLQFILTLCENGSLTQSTISPLDYNTTYYLTLTRDDDGGANSAGQLQLEAYKTNYSGEAGAVEEDTVTADCGAGEQNDFRYAVLAVPEGWSGGFNYYADGIIEDFDPDVGGGGGGGIITRVMHLRRLVAGD